jgi:hypothetical protein
VTVAGRGAIRGRLAVSMCGLKKELTALRNHDRFDGMKTLIIRKVPDELHRKVKMAAAAARDSMQDFIIKLLQKEVEKKGKPK